MQPYFLEPGILRVFRYYLVVLFLFIVSNALAHNHFGLTEENVRGAIGFGVVGTLLLLGFISWPLIQKRLGRLFFPLAIFFTTMFSLAQQNRFLQVRFADGPISNEESAWQIFLFLFIPLVLCAWQYHFGAVLVYCVLTAIVDYVMIIHPRGDATLAEDTYRRLILIRSLSFLAAGYVIAHIMARFRQQRTSLEQANRDLAHYASTLEELTVSRERNRMARELHDTLAHTLSGIAVQLEAAQTVLPDSPVEAGPLVARSLAMTRSGLTETRRALQDLRASPLEEGGLETALRALAADAAGRAGLQVDCSSDGAFPLLPPDVEQGLYRVVQEACENVARHAGAQRLRVAWSCRDGWLTVSIADDGRGFLPESVGSEGGFGLRGMRERAAMLGANLTIDSRPGQGTSIHVKMKV